ncbi:MAG: hypothetical protein GX958_06115 [Desulfitobacterium sp.]|nr:hypothetical protein [Desulfitobacterium sp.]
MRRMYVLIGSIAIGVGLLMGVVGFALANTFQEGASPLSFLGKNNVQTTSGTPEEIKGDSEDKVAVPDEEKDMDSLISGEENQHLTKENQHLTQDEEALDITIPTPGLTTKTIPAELEETIISEYKLNLAALFEAWQSPEMITFREKLSQGYTGELFEKHALLAEPYIAQGTGLHVTDIDFANVEVENATNAAATIKAKYSYYAQDFNLSEQMATGERKRHEVEVRVNMIKGEENWLITGETLL